MLYNKINSCRIKMSNIHVNKSKMSESSTIVKSNNTFFDSLEKFETHLISYLYARKIGFMASESVNQRILELIDYCKNCFNIKSVKNAESFRNKVGILGSDLSSEWFEYADEKNSNMITQLDILKNMFIVQKDFITIVNVLKSSRDWPLNETKYSEYLESFSNGEKILSENHFDEEISSFLNKVNAKKATLLDLNDRIIKWIKEENLEGNIRLELKRY